MKRLSIVVAALMTSSACGFFALPNGAGSTHSTPATGGTGGTGSTGGTGGTTTAGTTTGGGTTTAGGTTTSGTTTSMLGSVNLAAAEAAAMPAPSTEAGWLKVVGTQIQDANGNVWAGRGVSVHDTRQCTACLAQEPNQGEVQRRIDTAVGTWKANFVRFLMESYSAPLQSQDVQWAGITQDQNYLTSVINAVRYVGTKPNTYVLLSFFVDPSLDPNTGWPTSQTVTEWQALASIFKNDSHVMFAVCNEPQSNSDGSQDAQAYAAMQSVVKGIRAVEDGAGTPHHIISVQGTRDWSRYLDYYETTPMSPSDNVVYETHVYDATSEFNRILVTPKKTLPVIVAEFAPVNEAGVANMTAADTQNLMDLTESLHIPWIAWTFHQDCGQYASLLQATDPNDTCGVGMPLTPDTWGQQVTTQLGQAYGKDPAPPASELQ